MNEASRPGRSLIVTWLLGASVVVLVTISFEALSANAGAPKRCPVTGAAAFTAETASPACPALERRPRCPATGATAAPETPLRRCPAGLGDSRATRAATSV